MPDYTKTIIYKLVNYDYPDLVYVGSTTNFTKRKQNHKQRCLNPNDKKYNYKVYISIREYDGWENWNMIKICDYPCNNKREAELEEDRYMMELKANMNSHRASRTKQQYQEDNKEKLQKYFKEYREINKDHYKEYEKQRQEQRQEYMKEYMKEYREKNKETITEKKREKINCECGCEVVKNDLKRHQRTQKHIDLMK
jgi:hypothetical protein